ncbi:hypothetical protein D9615_002992 [Tricholomella constricta]|uniref:Uncharacterized protein n=1 Tax=Tricholomella constricta TaxID=117010 RepID=A0A8H5HG07_9AGAR|nr:hypothetical protein D9615_002992 [Tricholomella constricta]
MSIVDALPPSLNLPPHLSAHKYFLVCTLTVAAWDTLVLSPRTWRLMKTPGWPSLKILFNFLRVFMPAEFIIVAVAFFDTKWSQASCQKFYLFEPICTAILLAATSVIHVIRIHAIYDKNRAILLTMGSLFAVQIVITAISCGFYRSVPLKVGQGCIAGPKHNWVGIYWVAPTLLYTVSFGLALMRSINSLQAKPLSPWKLMLRDGLNLYGAIFLVNLTNMIFWFVITPTGIDDTIKTIVTSMAAVLTTSMSLRIILSVRGSLAQGGAFALSAHTQTGSSRTTHVISTRSGAVPTNVSTHNAAHTYTLDDMRSKTEAEWAINDKASDTEAKPAILDSSDNEQLQRNPSVGVKITIDREIGYDSSYHAK